MSEPARKWSETESETYRSLAEVAVPERERQRDAIVELALSGPATGPVLDLCCGEGLLSEAILDADPAVQVLAFDGSDSMLTETASRCDAARLTTRRIDLAGSEWRRFDRPLRAVVSSLAVHHLDGGQKRALFQDLGAALTPGGVFVLADVVLPASDEGFRLAARHFDEEARRRSLAIRGDLSGFDLFEREQWNCFADGAFDDIDRPSTIVDHIDWLRQAGFIAVDLHWMIAGHALFSARRP
ncbi:MAG: class I SAM-dependent methyltransferase [Rhizobiaceae bacterium]|nr:class I SAM-dependent methyltransferase [Rhizobiaceae bacterium]MCV0405058.1 class I SAM-dependent methyltransferase [Rhizobiaceae bacterium]